MDDQNWNGNMKLSEVLNVKKKEVGLRSECSLAYRLYFSTFIYRRCGFGIVSVITARFSNSAMWRGVHQPLNLGWLVGVYSMYCKCM